MGEKIRHEFRQLLSRQRRDLVLTQHAQMRAAQRQIENRLIQTDVGFGQITSIREQASTEPGERVFDIHLIGIDGAPIRYILAINSLIRVITLMKTNGRRPRKQFEILKL